MKVFIVNADHIKYNPKDVNGKKDMTQEKHAIILHAIKKTLTGFTTFDQFVSSDAQFYQVLAGVIGSDINKYSYAACDIEYDARGSVVDFSYNKTYDDLSGVADFFGIPKSDK